ncbi:MAG: immunoglobulin domain-containing protein [Opitutaceae bacterium]|nr:immunoglobulin domain-containing protein [Opitutaceae bacterium]
MTTTLTWHRFRYLHFPAALLSLLLQRAPMLQFALGSEAGLPGATAAILRSVFAAAALGSYHALAGATQLTTNPAQPVSGTVGVPLTVVFALTGGSVTSGGSYEVKGQFPPGMTVTNLQGDLLNADFGELKGTPTTAGSYSLSIRGFSERNKKGVGGQITFPLAVNIQSASVAPPVIVKSPVSQTIVSGSSVVFEVAATGEGLSYQWLLEGQAVPGATSPLLLLRNTTSSQAGNYTARVSNAGGQQVSAAALLNLVSSTTPGRLINLSVRSFAGLGEQTLIAGFVLTGSGSDALVLRGIGPKLADFNVPSVLADPQLTLFDSNQVPIQTNDNWSGADGRTAGGFALDVGSKDAVLSTALATGGYTAQVVGSGGTVGEAMAEVYEQPGQASGPLLVNLSARTQLDGGRTLIAGFVINGTTNRTVLVRAIGPGLGRFNVPGILGNPRMELYREGVKLAENDDWGGGGGLVEAMASVSAFPLESGASRDSVLVTTLSPGAYTANVTSVDGSSGVVLVEVYLLP